MKTHIRRREENKELIVVYGGWGIDQNAFLPLCTEDHDFILYYNYSADDPLILPDRKTYDRIVVIGWSLGVWAAEYFYESMRLNADITIAVNGTPVPADDKYGIPQYIFHGTMDKLDEKAIRKFNLRVFGGKTILEKNRDKLTKRDLSSYATELRWLYNRIMENPDRKYRWDIALSSVNDRVFPIDKQINYWNKRPETKHIMIDLPHYPFYHWGTFHNMIDDLIIRSGLDISYR